MSEWTAEQYDEIWAEIRGVKRYHRALHALVAQYVPGGSIVDIGCGTGDMLARLERFDRTLTGVDFSMVALEIAAMRTDAELVQADVRGYDFTRFDFAVMTEVMEHIIDPPTLLPDRWVASVPLGSGTSPNHVREYHAPEDATALHGGEVLEVTDRFIVFGAL